MEYLIQKATHVGRDHLLSLTNRQDANAVYDGQIEGQGVIAAIVCDGCSEGTSSETGANLAAAYLIREITRMLRLKVPLEIIPNLIYPNLLGFLQGILSPYQFVAEGDRIGFIKNHLLFTVVGFILTDSAAVCFITGDGTIVINEEVRLISADNKPSYPAYHLIDRKALKAEAGPLPDSFTVITLDRDSLSRLAIGSDAWHQETELLDQVWGFKHSAGLQRRINQWSKTEKRFKDDVTLITVEILDSVPELEDDDGSLD